jgi:hypothetical protein
MSKIGRQRMESTMMKSEHRELVFAWTAIGLVTGSAALAGWLASA